MLKRCCQKKFWLFVSLSLVSVGGGCGHRQGNAVASASPPASISAQVSATPSMVILATPTKSFTSNCAGNTPAISFDYPADWISDQAQTACFAVKSPGSDYASISLDIPKLPWHIQGMITLGMVCSGYVDDLKKNEMRDAVVKEKTPVPVPQAVARRIVSVGTDKGKASTDVAVVMIHADHVYILSIDSDQKGYDLARKTLDAAVASIKWSK